MSDFMFGMLCGAGGLMILSAVVVAVLVWRAPVIEADDAECGV